MLHDDDDGDVVSGWGVNQQIMSTLAHIGNITWHSMA
jgi:hypothetical protein